MGYFGWMNARNSKSVNRPRWKRYEVDVFRAQLKELERVLQGGWTTKQYPQFGPLGDMGKSDACIVAQLFDKNATPDGAIELQAQDEPGIRYFLETATELLRGGQIPKSIVLDTEPRQEKTEFGLLCVFVVSYLAKLEGKGPQS